MRLGRWELSVGSALAGWVGFDEAWPPQSQFYPGEMGPRIPFLPGPSVAVPHMVEGQQEAPCSEPQLQASV